MAEKNNPDKGINPFEESEQKSIPRDPLARTGSKPEIPPHAELIDDDLDDDDEISFNVTASPREGASAIIPMANLVEGGESGLLRTSWAELIVKPSPSSSTVDISQGISPPIKIDAFSDKDILERIVAEERAAGRVPPVLPVSDEQSDLLEAEAIIEGTSLHDSIHADHDLIPEAGPRSASSVDLAALLREGLLDAKDRQSNSSIQFSVPKSSIDIAKKLPRKSQNEINLEQEAKKPGSSPSSPQNIPAVSRDNSSSVPNFQEQFAIKYPTPIPNTSIPGPAENNSEDVEDAIDMGITANPTDSGRSSIFDALLNEVDIKNLDSAFEDSNPSDIASAKNSNSGILSRGKGLTGGGKSTNQLDQQGGSTGHRNANMTQPQIDFPDTDEAVPLSGYMSKSPTNPLIDPGSQWLVNLDEESSPKSGYSSHHDDDEMLGNNDLFNPEESVDLYSEPMIETGLTASGSLQISEEELDLAKRRAKMIESSSIDLSSHPSAMNLDLEDDVPSFMRENFGNSQMAPPVPGASIVDDFDALKGYTDPTHSGKEDDDDAAIDLSMPDFGTLSEDDRVDLSTDRLGANVVLPIGTNQDNRPKTPKSVTNYNIPAGDKQSSGKSPLFESNQLVPTATNINLDDLDARATPKRKSSPSLPEKRQPISTQSGFTTPSLSSLNPEPVSSNRGLYLGMGVGVVVGLAVFATAWLTNLLPNLGSNNNPPVADVSNSNNRLPRKTTPDVSVVSVSDARQFFDEGNLKKALEVYSQLGDDQLEVLTARGQTRWLDYLRSIGGNNQRVDIKNEAAKKAIADLQKSIEVWQLGSQNPRNERMAVTAVLWLGLIDEASGQGNKALKHYQDHLTRFSEDNRRILQSAISRLRLRLIEENKQALLHQPKQNSLVRATPMIEIPVTDLVLGFTMLLIQDAGQSGTTQPAAKKDSGNTKNEDKLGKAGSLTEAGLYFWDAMIAAASHNYARATTLLLSAQKSHQQQFLAHPSKGLNPYTDPREEMFLVCCDQLMKYWTLREKIYQQPGAEAIVQNRGFPSAIDFLVRDSETLKSALVELAKRLNIPKEGNTQQLINRALDDLLKAKMEAETASKISKEMLGQLNRQMIVANEKIDNLESVNKKIQDQLTAINASLEKAGEKGSNPQDIIASLIAKRDAEMTKLQVVYRTLKRAKIIDDQTAANDLPAKLEQALSNYARINSAKDGISPVARLLLGSTSSAVYATNLQKQMKEVQNQLVQEQSRVRQLKDTYDRQLVLDKQQSDKKLSETEKYYESLLKQSHTPVQSLDMWLMILDDFQNIDQIPTALMDVQIVEADNKIDEINRAKTGLIRALALRNQGKFAESQNQLGVVGKSPALTNNMALKARFQKIENGLRNPESLLAQTGGSSGENSLSNLETLLKRFPKEKFAKTYAQLIAKRAELKLEGGDLAGASADIKEAIELGTGAIAFLTQAKLAERTKQWQIAENSFQLAENQAPQGSRIQREARLGKLRVQVQKLQSNSETSNQKSTGNSLNSAENKVSYFSGSEWFEQLRNSWQMSLFWESIVLQSVFFMDSGSDSSKEIKFPFTAKIKENTKLEEKKQIIVGFDNKDWDDLMVQAEELIRSKEYHGHLIKADLLTQRGKYTEALQEFTLGLKQLGKIPVEYEGTLDRILKNHPGLQQPEGSGSENPDVAQRFFNLGYDAFFSGNYSFAEKSFLMSIRNGQDARYFYFLGLSRLAQGKKQIAQADFLQAAKLEKQVKPIPKLINASLERIQGVFRDEIEFYRP